MYMGKRDLPDIAMCPSPRVACPRAWAYKLYQANPNCPYYTVLIQIFEAHIFHGCHKFSIFTILFSRITVL